MPPDTGVYALPFSSRLDGTSRPDTYISTRLTPRRLLSYGDSNARAPVNNVTSLSRADEDDNL